MDSCRMQESQSIGSMRKMLLIQEEIFKHQVQELHRLYTLQKHLMQELEYRLIRPRKAKSVHEEMSGSLHPIKLGLAMPAESMSADEKDLKRIEEDNSNVEVELTLSIGHCAGIKRSENPSDRDRNNSATLQEKRATESNVKTRVSIGKRRGHIGCCKILSLHRT